MKIHSELLLFLVHPKKLIIVKMESSLQRNCQNVLKMFQKNGIEPSPNKKTITPHSRHPSTLLVDKPIFTQSVRITSKSNPF